uniref:Acyl-CoA dehydrogenase fadE25 n=1 Tax=Hirondellea gigas TaxID=1518452 RepID=A0A6A7FXG2_9CRUS
MKETITNGTMNGNGIHEVTNNLKNNSSNRECIPKSWGTKEFWGCGSEYDPDWVLTGQQKTLRDKLIELCRTTIRPRAVECDTDYKYPRESLDSLASLGLLGLIIPKELGGMGENHVCCAMVIETIARYGCPSTAMVYTMHLVGCSMLLLGCHQRPHVQQLLRRINKDKLIGTSVHSDPATGGHNWFPLSSKCALVDERTVKLLKFGAWATSAGYADWYGVQIVSPKFDGDFTNLSCFVVYRDDVRASSDDWSALGMHGNMSGPIIIEGKVSTDQMLGNFGDGQRIGEEAAGPFFYLCSSACWNGISMASMDLARKHTTRRAHADVGMRVCDYPIVQDYFGGCLSSTNSCRGMLLLLCQGLDQATDNCNWNRYADPKWNPRENFKVWLWQSKLETSENVIKVTQTMLKACGGTGYKSDLGVERLMRDGFAGCVMSASSELLRGNLGKSMLLGIESLDCWQMHCNERVLHNELNKMDLHAKKALMAKLQKEVKIEEIKESLNHPYQDTDFENPFNTMPPHYVDKTIITSDGIRHEPGLHPNKWTTLELVSRTEVSDKMALFVFGLPSESDHTGLLPGQYLAVQATIAGKKHLRYFSPISKPNDFGQIELALRFETHGIISQFFQNLKVGSEMEFMGPCGGFEYESNTLDELTLIASGGGITPGLQVIRCIMSDKKDNTEVNLIYYSDNYQDILYREELDEFAAVDGRLTVVHTLGDAPPHWTGPEGFIDADIIGRFVTKPNGRKHKIVLCGGPTMVLSCLYAFKALHFESEQIFTYGQFGTEQIRKVYGRNVKLSGHRCDNTL